MISSCARSTCSFDDAAAMIMPTARRAQQFLPDRLVGGDDDVVLVLPHHRAALRLQDADDAEGHVLDPDRLADRVLVAEELSRRLPEHADLRRRAVVRLGEELAPLRRSRRGSAASRPRPPGSTSTSSGCRRRPGPPSGSTPRRRRSSRTRAGSPSTSGSVSVELAPSRSARPTEVVEPGEDHQEVRPERAELALDLELRPLADADRRHDAGHADDDPEHREDGPRLVARDGPEGDLDDVAALGHDEPPARVAMSRFATGRSETTRRPGTSRSAAAWSAMSGSWVMSTIVSPPSLRRWKTPGSPPTSSSRGSRSARRRGGARVGDEGPRDGDPLLLAARELRRRVVHAVREPHLAERGARLVAPLPASARRCCASRAAAARRSRGPRCGGAG